MDFREAVRAVKVDNRIALCYYFRVADNLLKQANIYRDEKNIVDLYVMLLRFSSLISETIPFHQDYNGLDKETKRGYMKKLLRVLEELEELKPKVVEELHKRNKSNAANKQSKQKVPHGSESLAANATSNGVPSNFSAKQGVRPSHPLQKGPLISPARISFRIAEKVPYPDSYPRTNTRGSYHWGDPKSQGASSSSGNRTQNNSPWRKTISPATEIVPEDLISAPVPSAPSIENLVMDNASIDFPSMNSPSSDSFVAIAERSSVSANERTENFLTGSSCAVCMDASVEGACVPCGHMAGCMTCLNEIKEKSWGCPVCRAKIEMVLRLFAV